MFRKIAFDNKVEIGFDGYRVTIANDDSIVIEKKIIVYNPSEISAIKSKLKNEFGNIDFESLKNKATKNSTSMFGAMFNKKDGMF